MSVGASVGTQTATSTSYRCGALNVDSIGASPAGTLITLTGMALELAFGDAPDPTMVEARLYGGGLTATFGRWPDELPTDAAEVHRFEQATADGLGALPSLAGGPYSLVVRAEWAPDAHSFFPLNLMVLAP